MDRAKGGSRGEGSTGYRPHVHAGHRYFFADKPVADSVKKKIRKYKYYKNYRFSLRGYCQVRLLVFDTAEQKVFGNRAAWELVKGYAKMFRS